MKHLLLVLLVAVLVCGAFVAGLFLPKLLGGAGEPAALEQARQPVQEAPAAVPAVAEKPAFVRAEAPQLRIVGGDVEWFDGAQWQTYGGADALLAADPVAAAILERMYVLATAAEPAPTAPHLRAAGSIRRGGGGGGSSGGGGGGGSDGQDIQWSGDQL